jgi:hypothetical protein
MILGLLAENAGNKGLSNGEAAQKKEADPLEILHESALAINSAVKRLQEKKGK